MIDKRILVDLNSSDSKCTEIVSAILKETLINNKAYFVIFGSGNDFSQLTNCFSNRRSKHFINGFFRRECLIISDIKIEDIDKVLLNWEYGYASNRFILIYRNDYKEIEKKFGSDRFLEREIYTFIDNTIFSLLTNSFGVENNELHSYIIDCSICYREQIREVFNEMLNHSRSLFIEIKNKRWKTSD